MATITEAVSERVRKLSVADTLDHARRALSTHRQWLQRRISTEEFGTCTEAWKSTAENNREKDWMVADVEEDRDTLRENSSACKSAPPPTRSAQRTRVRKTSAKVSPASMLDSLVEEEETAVSHRVDWATGGVSNSSDDGLAPTAKKPKMKWTSRAAVSPAASEYVTDTTTPSVPMHLFISHPSVSDPASPAPPPVHNLSTPTPPLAAWGSLSSLDNYMESLEKTDTNPAELITSSSPTETAPASVMLHILSDKESCKNENINTRAVPVPSVPLHASHGDESPNDVNLSTHVGGGNEDIQENAQDDTLKVPDETEQSGELSSINISALKSNSSTTILPVCPAPKERQSSYEVHQYSKLEQVLESGVRVIEVEGRSPNRLDSSESAHEVRIALGERVSVSNDTTATSEPVVEQVAPYLHKKESSSSGNSTGDPDSKCGDLESAPSLNEAQTGDIHERKDESQPPTNMEAGGQKGRETASQQREETASNIRHEDELSFHPRVTSTPSSGQQREVKPPPEQERKVNEEDSEERRRHILEELQLPPLKESATSISSRARSILSKLPRLKPQTPTNTDISPELKLSRKRLQELPLYVTHHRTAAGQALNPPCPQYGVKQPEDSHFQRKRLYSAPSSHPEPSPPHSPLRHRKMATQHVTYDKCARAYSVSQAVNSARTPPPSPTHKNTPRPSSAKQPQKHVSLGRTMSSPDKPISSAQVIEGGGGGGGGGAGGGGRVVRRGPSALDSPLLRRQMSRDVSGSTGASERRGSTNSLYLMNTGPGPLHLAAKFGNLRQLQHLMLEGENVDMRDHEGRTPLMYCIHSRGVHLSCASLLIQAGAGLDKQSSDGSTVIHLAAAVGAISLIEFAILNHADPDIRDFEGRLPIHWATMSRQSSKCAALLLKHSKLDINAVDDAGMTPLMWAAYNNNPIVTAFLLSQGADCEEKDMDGMTAMHWAIHHEGVKCLDLMLKADHTYFKDHKGRTVLHRVAEVGCMAACELVLRLRADAVHDLDRMARTPLHYAAACSRVDVCALLLDRGGDASQRDLAGKTAIEYARQKKLDYVVALLTCHGTAVADFARASRSSSMSSLLTRAMSFSKLPVSGEGPDNQDLITESIQPLPRNDHIDATVMGDGGEAPTDPSLLQAGAFLGRFVQYKNDPLQHFFFWLAEKQRSRLCWSRERDRRRPQEALVYEVHEGPSESLQQNPAYSSNELHQHVFWVLTDCGMLDLLAYNEAAYGLWVIGLRNIAQGTPETPLEGSLGDKNSTGGPKTAHISPKRTGLEYKKLLHLKTKRSISVAPAVVIENEAARNSSTITNSSERDYSDIELSSPVPTNQHVRSQESPQRDNEDII